MAGHSHNKPIDYVRKAFIVSILLGIVIGINHYVPHGGSKAALIALGFVILAAYLIGELVEIIKLPHITGYLLAGLVLGPSLPHTLHDLYPDLHLIPPFDKGLINQDVIHNLGVLDTLALPLICLTAGSALNPKEIWSAIRPIVGVLFGQIITMFVGMVALVYCLSGVIPGVQIDAFVGLSIPALLSIGGLIGAISLATSDAATIAIVVSTKAKGAMTTNIISVAVLKDIVVVIAFAAMTTLAMGSLGLEGGESLGKSIQLIILSAVLGIVLGGVIHLYLRYVKEEVLLFLTALIYTISFASDFFHLESALMFIVAGFVAKNWSAYGDELIDEVERLSAPVFVVFFTLAGAQLHLDVLAKMAVVALLLAGVRALAFFVGVRLGSIVSGADEGTRKYAWMGFVSQAGLAITLAKGMPGTYGPELGGALFSFILGGVAINEVIGPAMLQSALGLAGELPSSDKKEGVDGELQEQGWYFPVHAHPQIVSICGDVQKYLQDLVVGLHNTIQEERLRPLEASKNTEDALTLFAKKTTLSLWDSASLLREMELFSSSLDDQLLVPYEEESFVRRSSNSRLLNVLLFFQQKRVSLTGGQRMINPRNIARVYLDTHCAKELVHFVEAQAQFDLAVGRALKEKNDEALEQSIELFRTAMASFEKGIIHHHRQFCFDLMHINTFLVPSRTLQSSFDIRNEVVRTLCFDMYKARPNVIKILSYFRYEEQIHKIQQSLHVRLKSKTNEGIHVFQDFIESQKSYVSEIKELLEKDDRALLLDCIQKNHDSYLSVQEYLLRKEPFYLAGIEQLPKNIDRPLGLLPQRIYDVGRITFKTTMAYNHILSVIRNRVEPRYYTRFASLAAEQKRLFVLVKEQLEIVQYAKKIESNEDVLTEPMRRSLHRFALQLKEREQKEVDSWSIEDEGLREEFVSMCFSFTEFDDFALPGLPLFEHIHQGAQRVIHWGARWKNVLDSPRLRDPIEHWQQSLSSYMRLFERGIHESSHIQPSRTSLKSEIEKAKSTPGLHVLLGPYEESCSLICGISSEGDGENLFSFEEHQESDFLERSGSTNFLIGMRWLFRYTGKDSPFEKWVHHLMDHPEQTWIVVEDPHVWSIMSENFFLADLVVHQWVLPKLSCPELAEVMLARHQLSGFDIEYPDSLSWNRITRWHEENAKNRFFSYLHEQSRGNIREAFLLWMASVDHVDEKNGRFVMKIAQHGLLSALENVSVFHLLLLKQILQYGGLDIVLVQQFFCCSKEKARAGLSFLRKERFIVEKGGYWFLVSTVRFSLITVLKKRGWL